MMRITTFAASACLTMLSWAYAVYSQPLASHVADSTAAGYRIDQPGTITFTVGLKIKGKVEKPQVMIFLPKERPYYRDPEFTRSFRYELSEPIPLSPLLPK